MMRCYFIRSKLAVSWKFIKWLLWDFSGLRYIYGKASPSIPDKDNKTKPPATFLLWIVGIYIALYGVASQRYENMIDKIEIKENIIISMFASKPRRALKMVPQVQNITCPLKPDILSPLSVFSSFYKETLHQETIDDLKILISNHKELFYEGGVFRKIYLNDIDLVGTKFKETYINNSLFDDSDLRAATFINSVFNISFFKNSMMSKSQIENAVFSYTDFENATFEDANIKNSFFHANFENANFMNAKFENVYLCHCNFKNIKHFPKEQLINIASLFGARNLDPDLVEIINDQYPHLLKPNNDIRECNDEKKGSFSISIFVGKYKG